MQRIIRNGVLIVVLVAVGISMIVCFATATGTVLLCASAGYAFSRLQRRRSETPVC